MQDIAILPLEGPLDWFRFQAAVEQISLTLGQTPYGLLGLVISAPRWLLMPANGQAAGPYFPIAHPGPQPAQPPAGPHAAWVIDMARFEAENRDIGRLLRSIASALDPATRARIRDPVHNMNLFTVPLIMARLSADYGTATPGQITEIQAPLHTPYSDRDTTFAQHILVHLNIHCLMGQYGVPIQAWDTVRFLRDSVARTALFAPHLLAYDAAFPTLLLQTFDNLALALQRAADQEALTPTLGTSGYVPPNAAAAEHRRNSSQRHQQGRSGSCFSHGDNCGHDSADCRNPFKPGHPVTRAGKSPRT